MAKIMPKRNLERVGLGVTGACVALVTLVVLALIFMVAQRGLTTFIKDGVDVAGFFTGTKWNLASTGPDGLPATGALPLIVTSFSVTVLSTVLALPVALGSAIFTVEIAPKFGRRVFQPLIELLVGIPSVVFGLIGFHVIVGAVRAIFNVNVGLGARRDDPSHRHDAFDRCPARRAGQLPPGFARARVHPLADHLARRAA